MEIDVLVDSLTNCLIESSTGKEFDTEFHKVEGKITKSDAERLRFAGWKFDWSVPQNNGYEIYELYIKNDSTVQGKIALKHIFDQYYTHVDIVEAAPDNVGSDGKYKGVGAHLFAIACKLSWDVGNEGYVQFTAKSGLVEHYRETIGAQNIDRQIMYIDSYGAVNLIRKYFKEGYKCL